jgi:hypothetical protein
MGEDYNLIYIHKETRKEYLVKRVTRLDFRIKDPDYPETSLPLSYHALHSAYEAHPDNQKRQKKVKLDFRKRNLCLTDKKNNPCSEV